MAMADDDDDDFWAKQGFDIIDQMVEQHTREKQTQDKKKQTGPGANGAGGAGPWASSVRRGNARRGNGSAAGAAPPPAVQSMHAAQLNRQRTFGGGAFVPEPHGIRPDYASLLAEREGSLSIIRDRLNKSEHENVKLRQRIQELSTPPAQSVVERSATVHLEQQVMQLKQQLAFKDEEMREARRLGQQREEKLHMAEEEAARNAKSIRHLQADMATAEAEHLMRRQGKELAAMDVNAPVPPARSPGGDAYNKRASMTRSTRDVSSSGPPFPWSPAQLGRPHGGLQGLGGTAESGPSCSGGGPGYLGAAPSGVFRRAARDLAEITQRASPAYARAPRPGIETRAAEALLSVLTPPGDGKPASILGVLVRFFADLAAPSMAAGAGGQDGLGALRDAGDGPARALLTSASRALCALLREDLPARRYLAKRLGAGDMAKGDDKEKGKEKGKGKGVGFVDGCMRVVACYGADAAISSPLFDALAVAASYDPQSRAALVPVLITCVLGLPHPREEPRAHAGTGAGGRGRGRGRGGRGRGEEREEEEED